MEKLEFTSEDMERYASGQTRETLMSVLRNLTEVRRQRSTPAPDETATGAALRRAEVHGLNVAIGAIRRRLR